MKKLSFIIVFVFLSILFVQAQQAKYVFYFIGDGMGVNQVLGTEMYRGELEGKIGVTPLLFTQFPYATIATTFSATNGVTDSAAAGTALATGNKTKNGALGVKKDLETKVNSVASWAKNKGCRVGISTSVSVDHATPAAFYAHQGQRSSYYNVGLDLIDANFMHHAGRKQQHFPVSLVFHLHILRLPVLFHQKRYLCYIRFFCKPKVHV